MHNNIMAAGSRDRLPMLATRRYPQWRSRVLRYIDTRPNGDALRKCILNGPYIPTTVLVQVVAATDDSLTIPEHTTIETPMNMSPTNKAHFEVEKEAIHLILTGIGDEIYSTVDACQTAQEIQNGQGQVLADFINEIPVGTRHMEVRSLAGEGKPEGWTLYTDKAPACQMNGKFVASNEGMAKYLAKAKEQAVLFKKFSIKNIPRNQNQKADVLSKLASVAFNHLTKEILVEILNAKSVDVQEVSTIVKEKEDNWMTPVVKCLKEGVWPTDENEARTLRMKIDQYVVEDGVLFKKSYLSPMLRCVAKIMRQGYCWPTMHGDTKEVVDKCDSCQIHSSVLKLSRTRITSIMSLWPFYQWGLDILGHLPKGPDKLKFIIVAIDYFTKWIEAKPLAKTTGKEERRETVAISEAKYKKGETILQREGSPYVVQSRRFCIPKERTQSSQEPMKVGTELGGTIP
nr:reverse transcriptase domain-containing protein [Tanacetum cinerariifolium]